MEACDLERLMKRLFPWLMVVAACGPGVYTRAEVVYAEPADRVYVVPADRVIVVTREVLVQRGYVVYRVEDSGPNRIVWARRRGVEKGRSSPVRRGPPPDGDRGGGGAASGEGSPRRRRAPRAGAPLGCRATPAAGPAPPGRVDTRLTITRLIPPRSRDSRFRSQSSTPFR